MITIVHMLWCHLVVGGVKDRKHVFYINTFFTNKNSYDSTPPPHPHTHLQDHKYINLKKFLHIP